MVDDENQLLEQAQVFLERENDHLEIEKTTSVRYAIDLLESGDYDVIVSEYQMPEIDGLEFLKVVRDREGDDIPFIIFTGEGREKVAINAVNMGADRYILKQGDPKKRYGILADAIQQEVNEADGKKAKLQKKNRKLQNIIDNLNDAIYIYRLTDEGKPSNFLEVNEVACDMLDYTKEEFMDLSLVDIDANSKEIPRIMGELSDEEDVKLEMVHETKDEKTIPVEIHSHKFGLEDEERVISVARDISDRKKAKRRFKNFFENLGDAVFVTKVGGEDYGKIMEANPAALEQTGYSRDELMGMDIAEDLSIKHPEEIDYRDWDRKLSEDKTVKAVDKKQKKDGTEYWTEVVTTPIDFKDEKASLSINRDITEKKEAHERIEFLHTLLRHDIKNKAQVVQGYLQLLEDDIPLIEEAKEYVDKALKGNRESINLIQKIRTLLKAQKENREEIDISDTLREAVENVETLVHDRGMDISLKSSSKECKVEGGPLLKEVFTNIIENSAYHSGGTQIKISEKVGHEEVICIIEDDGKGIPDEKKESIFEKGYTTDKARGTGLGMFLVKMLLETYGGDIEVNDSELDGARFDIHLKKVRSK